MLSVFLPPLIFESAFDMDVHTFKRIRPQILLLAGPGMLCCTLLTAVMVQLLFGYGAPPTPARGGGWPHGEAQRGGRGGRRSRLGPS